MFHSPLIWESTQDKQTDKLYFNSLLKLESTQDRQTGQTTFNFTPHIGMQVRQTEKLGQTMFYLNFPIGNYARQTDGQSTFHSIPHIGIYVKLTEGLTIQRKTDGRAMFHEFGSLECTQDRLTEELHWMMDKLRLISLLILESTQDRQMNKLCYLRKIFL